MQSGKEPPRASVAANDDAPALRVTGVSYAYGRHQALDNVSFQLAPAKVTALLGPNGAGKTTLYSIVTGLFDSRAGAIEIAGHDLRRDRAAALFRIGIVFQAQTLDLDLTVQQNLRYFAALRGLSRSAAHARIDTLLDQVGLADKRRVKTRSLSGGQRRRVEVARALLDHPALLLLDEPSAGLDIATRRWLVDHVHRLAREEGIAVLWATHLTDEVMPEDHLIVLEKGRVVADGPLPDVLAAAGETTLDGAFAKLTSAPVGERL
ncbi:ATP-binding cassette domain-containing protein [Breoghania sp. L-A4]|uniref:ATP-binding cassette domain-containing protein n=1 Tax=Breoghania sp. L-A4 TaxID=2304600 RepID=UPI000E359E19|nr:ATP-binding cassette domain-containing protein [Breoghania sp. L-A4]AXS39760.1 ATP-binding cassette domain-containing protein [Breoghania sp. L-A4]